MAHLAEDTPIRACDALNAAHRAVGVPQDVAAYRSVRVHILEGDLAVFNQPRQSGLVRHKPALAVGDRDGVHVPGVHAPQPGGFHAGRPGIHHAADMAAQGVEGQGGRGSRGLGNRSIGQQAQLNQRLKAVADAQHQAVPVFQQVRHCLGNAGVAEGGGNKLAGAFRLIAAGKAAGQHDDLAGPDGLFHALHGFRNVLGAQVAHHQHIGKGPRLLKSPGRVHLAVGARERRNKHPGLGIPYRRGQTAALAVQGHVPGHGGGGGAAGEDPLQNAGPSLRHLVQRNFFPFNLHRGAAGGPAQQRAVDYVGLLREGHHQGALQGGVQILLGQAFLKLEAQLVAQAHAHGAGRRAAFPHYPGGYHIAAVNVPQKALVHGLQPGPVGHAVLFRRNPQQHQLGPRMPHTGGKGAAGLGHAQGKAHQSGRHIQILKGAGHAVLAANGGQAHAGLGAEGPQQGGGGLAPADRVLVQAGEVFLEGQPGGQGVRAHGGQLGEALHHRVGRAHKGGILAHPGNVAIAHGGSVVGLAGKHWHLCHHGLLGGQLVAARVGHQHRGRANTGVKPLYQTLLAADLQPGHVGQQGLAAGFARQSLGHGGAVVRSLRRGDHRLRVLGNAVGVQKGPGQVHHLVPPPAHFQPGFFRHHGHGLGVQVLLRRQGPERLHVLGRQHHGHALLALGDGQLGPVQALILFRDLVQVDGKARGQLANGHAHAARAEVVAALDELGRGGLPEEPLNFPLGGRIALLHLRPAYLHGLLCVGHAGAGGPANAVAAGGPAQQDDYISRRGPLPAHVFLGRGSHHRADFQALGHIAGVVELRNLTGGQTHLVAIAGIALRRAGGDLPAGQLALQSGLNGQRGVAGAGDPHGLIDVSPAREGIPDGPAQAGGGPAEGLNLRGMVVGLVFKLNQPGLDLSVHGNRRFNGAGIDLLAYVQVRAEALFAQVLAANGGHIH